MNNLDVLIDGYIYYANSKGIHPTLEGFRQVLDDLGEDGVYQCLTAVPNGAEAVAAVMTSILG